MPVLTPRVLRGVVRYNRTTASRRPHWNSSKQVDMMRRYSWHARSRDGVRSIGRYITGSFVCHPRLLALAAVATVTAISAIPVKAQERPDAVLILDGSGSMWGAFGKRSKLVVSREALIDQLPLMTARTNLSFMAYGHRRRRDCRDVQTLVPFGRVGISHHQKALERLSPVGKTPMSTAMERAFETLKDKAGDEAPKGHIVVMTDGFENCRKDPCALARRIASEAPAVRVHVLGLKLKNEDRQSLQCIPRPSGGLFVDADQPEEFKTAVLTLFEQLGGATVPAQAEADAAEAAKAETERPAPAPTGPPVMLLRAIADGTGTPLNDGLLWSVTNTPDGEVVFSGADNAPRLEGFDPGEYDVTVRAGLAENTTSVTLAERGPTELEIPLAVARLTVSAYANPGLPRLEDVFITLARDSGGSDEPETVIAMSRDPQPQYDLPPETYRVTAEYGLARVEDTVTLTSGSARKLDLNFFVGALTVVVTSDANGTPVNDALIRIFRDDPVATDGRREVMRSTAARPTFTLRSDVYHVVAQRGAAKVETTLALEPGKVVRQALRLPAATLRVSSVRGDGSAPIEGDMSYSVYAADAKPGTPPIATTARPRGQFNLAAGRYRVVGHYGSVNARAEAIVAVEAGQTAEVKLGHDAGEARFALETPSGAPIKRGVAWEIHDKTDRVIWRTSSPAPTTPLATGTYRAIARHRDAVVETNFSVGPGAKTQINLRLP